MVNDRAALVRVGLRLEFLTVTWMVVEAAVSLGAGFVAGSALLVAFGLDSLIELLSGAITLWRLRVESRGGDEEEVARAERRASRITATLLLLLCAYVLVSSVYGLVARSVPEVSPAGIAVSALAVAVMPWLGLKKREVAGEIESDALKDDAAESITCAYMAATVLVGVLLNALFRWWWVEDIAALGFLLWLGRETAEAISEAREEEPS